MQVNLNNYQGQELEGQQRMQELNSKEEKLEALEQNAQELF